MSTPQDQLITPIGCTAPAIAISSANVGIEAGATLAATRKNGLTVGTHVDISHAAATPPGLQVAAQVRLTAVEGRQLTFAVEAHDDIDLISRGTHRRAIIDAERFAERTRHKLLSAGSDSNKSV